MGFRLLSEKAGSQERGPAKPLWCTPGIPALQPRPILDTLITQESCFVLAFVIPTLKPHLVYFARKTNPDECILPLLFFSVSLQSLGLLKWMEQTTQDPGQAIKHCWSNIWNLFLQQNAWSFGHTTKHCSSNK